MNLRPLALAALCLLPLPTVAQVVGDGTTGRLVLLDDLLRRGGAASGPQVSASRVVPVWISADGRIATALAIGNEGVSLTPPSPQITSALDWRLVDASALLRSELRLGTGAQRLRASAGLGQQALLDPSAVAGAACFGVPHWLGTPTAMDACTGTPEGAHAWHTGSLSAGWSNGPLSLDLVYDLGWLQGARSGLAAVASAPGLSVLPWPVSGSALPSLVLPGGYGLAGSREQWGALGHWEVTPGNAIDLGASLGRIRLLPEADGVRGFSQTALSLGLNHGSLSGNITGRLNNPLQPLPGTLQRWTSIDLGVTWRTPWQGELSVGAQNLWSTPSPPGDEADAQARVPYVQYRQDL